MSDFIHAITRLQDADDANMSPSAGQDTYAITYDHATLKFILSAISAGGLSVDTRANLLASSPSSNTLALSSDTLELMAWDQSGWYVAPLEFDSQSNSVDMGLTPPMVTNDRSGYNGDNITDKTLNNVAVGGGSRESPGVVRVLSDVLQVYLNSDWRDVTTGISLREDSDTYELETRPFGLTTWIEVFSGNSHTLGLNGLPLVQQYKASMGPFPVHQRIVGREITS